MSATAPFALWGDSAGYPSAHLDLSVEAISTKCRLFPLPEIEVHDKGGVHAKGTTSVNAPPRGLARENVHDLYSLGRVVTLLSGVGVRSNDACQTNRAGVH